MVGYGLCVCLPLRNDLNVSLLLYQYFHCADFTQGASLGRPILLGFNAGPCAGSKASFLCDGLDDNLWVAFQYRKRYLSGRLKNTTTCKLLQSELPTTGLANSFTYVGSDPDCTGYKFQAEESASMVCGRHPSYSRSGRSGCRHYSLYTH